MGELPISRDAVFSEAAWPADVTTLGFTGSRFGMTREQCEQVELLLGAWAPTEVHHGDAVGADAQFHALVRQVLPQAQIIIHPPQSQAYRAFCAGDEERPPLPYLTRNRAIVQESQVLMAAPKARIEELRSGTWATIRFALRSKRPLCYVLPKE